MDTDNALVLPYVGASAGEAAPLKVSAATFTTKTIVQSTPYPKANNTLTCTLSVNTVLGTGSKISILGLAGSTTASSSTLQLQGSGKHVFGNSSEWKRELNTMILTVGAGQTMQTKVAYVLTFVLKNSDTAQASTYVSILARGYVAPSSSAAPVNIPVSRMTIDPECVPNTGTTWLKAAVENHLTNSISVLNSTEIGITAGRQVQINEEIMLIIAVTADNVLIVRRGQHGTNATCHADNTMVYHSLIGTTTGDCVPLRTLSPGFVLRTSAQTSFYMDTDNDITVTLATNIDLSQATSSAVTLKGLVETQTNDTAYLSLTYQTGEPQVFGSSGVWTSKLWHPDPLERVGRLVLTVASGLTMFSNTPYVFTFTLKNFKQARVPVSADLGQVAATIMVSARGSARLPAVLVNSDPARYPCSSSTTLSASIVASATSMTVTSSTLMLAGRVLVVDDEVVDIVSVSGSTVVMKRGSAASAAVGHRVGAPVCIVQAGGKPGMAMPLALYKQGVILMNIGQSTPLPLAANTITVTFVTNIAIDNAAWSNIIKLTISGLTGSTTVDNSALTVSDVESSGTATYFESGAAWTQSSGTLVLSQKIFVKIPAGQTLKFTFAVTNSATERFARSMSFIIYSTEMMHAGHVTPDEDTLLNIPGAIAGDAAPLRVWANAMTIKTIAQSTPFPGDLNTITVFLSPSGYLSGAENSKVTIEGLIGVQTSDSSTLAITDVGSTSANVLFGSTAGWTKTSGMLVLTVAAGQTLGAGQGVSFSFQVTNPAPKTSPVPILVSASGSRVLGPERMMVQDRIAPSTASTTLSQDVHTCANFSVHVASATGIAVGTVLQIDDELMYVSALAGTHVTVTRANDGTRPAWHKTGTTIYLIKDGCSIGDAVPLRVQARSLFSVHIGQSTSSPSQTNTLKVTLALNSPLDTPVLSKITIVGLIGSATGNSNNLVSLAISDVGSPSATNIFGGTGSWNQTAGSLVLTVAAGQSISSTIPLVFSFDLQNPAESQAPSPTSIMAECVHSDAVLHYTTDGSQPTSSSSTYSTAVAVTTGQTLKVVASYDNQRDSQHSSATYT